MKQDFDAIIVGAGQAGPALAGRLTQAGWSVAFVERKLFGGTCVNNGCTPTKAMVASAHAAHIARRGSDFGVVRNEPVTIDMRQVMARKNAIVMKSRTGIESWLRSMERCTVFTGTARFQSANEMRIGDTVLGAKHIFLNVGARPAVPDMPGVGDVPFLTSTTILDLEELPKHLIVVGGSYVGLEFAQIFRRFGSEVTVIERKSRLIPNEDADLSSAVQEILHSEGIQFRLDANCIRLEKQREDVAVGLDCLEGHPQVVGSRILLAAGRKPNTNDLGLDVAGVKTDERGYITVDDQLQTSVPGIWALGDCNGRGAFTHTAYNDFEIVADNLLDKGSRRVSDRIPASALYIDPPLAQVGLTETEVRQSGRAALIGTRPMAKVSRAVEKGESQGFMKVLVDAESKKILGAAILGTDGDEAIHCILSTMYAGAPYTTLSHAVHIHPTVSELIPTMLQSMTPLADAK
ncbi:FAD-containing oxidoreductase [Granulicella sp. S190]|uniref:FAD-containing oxidoreductase n=1 Tax=Granulicella sp. S190 TaxID=1747226 RepID=UPI00131BFA51|nr:FAD-containing oxidoreductase [Granulicella sp. S190]